MTLVEDILPRDLDIDPVRFPSWRAGQYGIFMDTLECQTRVSGHCVSCGFGKTLIMAAHARATGKRTLILTPFKGLQDQITREMGFIVDLRGKANYQCKMLGTNCEIGSPRCGVRKSAMGTGLCDHKAATDRASKADIVVMNYSCWFHQIYGQGIGKFDTIILDECFVAGTKIDGVSIEKIQVGKIISSFDEAGRTFYQPVVRTSRRRPHNLCTVRFQDGTKITCTHEHPIFTSIGWKKAIELTNSTVLRSRLDWVGVDCVEIHEQTSDGTFGGMCPDGFVYNLEVEGTHTYFANGIGVHNCDQADSALADHLSFTLSSKEVLGELHQSRAPHWNDPIRNWMEWGASVISQLTALADQAEEDAKNIDDSYILERFFHLRSLRRKVSILKDMSSSEWVAETVRDGIRFDPIWPGRFAEEYLFRKIPRVLLFSGTLNEKTFGLLGISKSEHTFYEYPSPFHPFWNPLILVPAGDIKAFNHPIQRNVMDAAVNIFDKIVDARMDRKGILHTVSFTHLNDIIERSRHANLFVSNDMKYSGGIRKTMDVVELFKMSMPPAILASPSITAGWNFPDDVARWQFILKVPFPDTTSLVAKARQKLDREYYNNKAMTALVQICSRSCRSESDWCENIIPDPRVGWFLRVNEHLAPKWFIGEPGVRRFRRMAEGVLPKPMVWT